ncbi:MAG: AGE family epimerase/isomerase [Armatimonadota bacterium]
MFSYIDQYEQELLEGVLPFWMEHSLDREHGGYFTCLTTDGRCYDPRKYMWLQGRQVWMLAKMFNVYEKRQEWLDASRLGLDFIRRFGRNEDGRVYFSLTRDGQPASMQRKIFSECFYVMALAEYFRATGDQSVADEALGVFNLIEHLIAYPEKLGRPVLAGAVRVNSLAVPMITLGLLEELEGLMPPETIGAKGAVCLNAMMRHYDSERRLLREFVSDGESIEALPEGRLVNPGHSIEAAWFLMHYAQRRNDQEIFKQGLAILEGSLDFGWDPQYGGLFYFMDSAGYPLPQLEHDMKLWWPHTEALYALVAAWCATEDEKYVSWHKRVHDYSFEHFADPINGEWFGYCNRRGDVTHQAKGGPYKGCFHLPRALLFSIQALKRHEGNVPGQVSGKFAS